MSKEVAISKLQIESRIFTIRGNHVMIDRDLAEMYQVETKVLNQAVKRNIERLLTMKKRNWSQIVTGSNH